MSTARAFLLAGVAVAFACASAPLDAGQPAGEPVPILLAQTGSHDQPMTISPGERRQQDYDGNDRRDYDRDDRYGEQRRDGDYSGRGYDGEPSQRYDRAPQDQYGGPPPGRYGEPGGRAGPGYEPPPEERDTFSMEEILDAGHRFFGRVSMGLARVVEYTFQRAGRPNGYILGEEAGGAFVAGLRYGEGMLYTKDAGEHKIYWQGPSIGYDFGAEGSKTMVLVYNLRDIDDMYTSFAGVDGSAYFVGGVGVTFLSRDWVKLAPIRSGVGLRLGANIGYLKYTPRPTWNPF